MYQGIDGLIYPTLEEVSKANQHYWYSIDRAKHLYNALGRINLLGENPEEGIRKLNEILMNIIEELKVQEIPTEAFSYYFRAFQRFQGYRSYLTSINDLAIGLNMVSIGGCDSIKKQVEMKQYKEELNQYIKEYFQESDKTSKEDGDFPYTKIRQGVQ